MLKNGDRDDEIPLGYLQPSSEPDSLGRLGHYEILEVVGRGAFGTVLRAFDEKLQRVVAIKVLAPEMAATSPARKRFLREARTSAAVRHENVVSIYAVEDEPIPYLVMEYIPGKTLQQRLDEHGPLDLSEVLRLGKQIADGLTAAHAENLIHRDVKPGNILLEGGMDERVKITDFGLARTADDASMTQSGVIAGTPMYMAPEQAHGDKLDQRADLFSFGSVLYQMLSGRPPFRAPTTMAVLKRVTEDDPRPIQEIIPEVPEWMSELIGHLLAKNPDERYGSAREVGDLLDHCLTELQQGHNPNVSMPAAASRNVGAALQPAQSGAEARRPLSTLLKTAALVLILLVAALSMTELTGVTNLTATVFSPTPGAKTIVAESDEVDKESARGEFELQQPQLESAESRADAPPLAKAPFDTAEAQQHQQAWADYLDVPVEKEIVLGQNSDGKDVTLSMVLVPPGEFLMGTDDVEKRKWIDAAKAGNSDVILLHMEGPRHFVRITKPFWLSKYEFTTGQFRRFAESTGYQTDAETNGKGGTKPAPGPRVVRDPELNWDNWGKVSVDRGPVVNVSWNDATKCCQWLSAQNPDLTFALPTESQWEYACRAGTTTPWYGCETEQELPLFAQFKTNASFIKPGGQLKANAFGLRDMHGNVSEWCLEWANINYYRRSPTDDPPGASEPADTPRKAVRGGSFLHPARSIRSAARAFAPPDDCFFDRGFRVAAAISDDEPQEAIARVQNRVLGLQFDGDDDYVATPVHFDGSTGLTIEATVQLNEWPNKLSSEIVSNTHKGGVSLGASNRGFKFAVHNGDDYVHAEAPRD
ncbi:MAG: bifunctional serine/threonine-protein kinase/formylglycine-generating enzyme family protein, partial [Planctomycetota bacterium]